MKAGGYIAIGVLAIAGYLLLMKNKGQQFLVSEDVILPSDTQAETPATRPTTRTGRTPVTTYTAPRTASTTTTTSVARGDRVSLSQGDIIAGPVTQEIVHSAPGTIGPVQTPGVWTEIGGKSVFIPTSFLIPI